LADFGEDSFKGFNVADGLGDAGKKLAEKSLFEFTAFGVVPVMFGLLPFGTKAVGQRDQLILRRTHDLESPPFIGDSTGAGAFAAELLGEISA
jgi:hypothetical protein